jgi:hypothetical protein
MKMAIIHVKKTDQLENAQRVGEDVSPKTLQIDNKPSCWSLGEAH